MAAGGGSSRTNSPRVLIRSTRASLTRPATFKAPPAGPGDDWQERKAKPHPPPPEPEEPPPPPPPVLPPVALSWTPEQLARSIAALGDDYTPLARAMLMHGVSGAMLPLMDASQLPRLLGGLQYFHLIRGVTEHVGELLVPPPPIDPADAIADATAAEPGAPHEANPLAAAIISSGGGGGGGRGYAASRGREGRHASLTFAPVVPVGEQPMCNR